MALIDLILPPSCAGCGSTGELLCTRCRGAARALTSFPDRFVVADPAVVIGESLELAVAAFAYDGPIRRALAALKYGGASRIAPILADAMLPTLGVVSSITGRATLVPVPVHRERERARGYNQAGLIARRLAQRTGLPYVDVLERARTTTKQHELRRAERLRNLRGAFAIRDGMRQRVPRTAILVDDIITTSGTLEACAGVLQRAGCEETYGLAVAREV